MSAIIKELNDNFRKTGVGGQFFITHKVAALSNGERKELIRKVSIFNSFDEKNDPYNEHDFGSMTHNGAMYFWKIDYYNKDMSGGSEDPSDKNKTTRVLTLMEANEY
ncbi:hypothetical protein FACS1894204_11270 [Synergistales bacterium]|nr:hypothetical protein FACS1894204_11270 [Synergistales bacterium]